jgi:NTE family protein
MFGAPGAPKASVRDAVLASCSIPWVFAPVTIEGREYVDGGVWSPASLDQAPAGHGSRVLCLNPTASIGVARGGLAFMSRSAVAAEAVGLRRRGAEVRIVAPDAASTEAMGTDLMDGSRAAGVLDAAFAQGRRLATP